MLTPAQRAVAHPQDINDFFDVWVSLPPADQDELADLRYDERNTITEAVGGRDHHRAYILKFMRDMGYGNAPETQDARY